jgi:hypothetical protein
VCLGNRHPSNGSEVSIYAIVRYTHKVTFFLFLFLQKRHCKQLRAEKITNDRQIVELPIARYGGAEEVSHNVQNSARGTNSVHQLRAFSTMTRTAASLILKIVLRARKNKIIGIITSSHSSTHRYVNQPAQTSNIYSVLTYSDTISLPFKTNYHSSPREIRDSIKPKRDEPTVVVTCGETKRPRAESIQKTFTRMSGNSS